MLRLPEVYQHGSIIAESISVWWVYSYSEETSKSVETLHRVLETGV